MRKLITCLLSLLLVVSMSACGCKQEENVEDELETEEQQETISDYSKEENTSDEQAELNEEEASEPNPALNYEYDVIGYEDDEPHRFRTCVSEFKKADEKYVMDPEYVPSDKGLEYTYMSGSAEFSYDQFEVLINNLNTISKGEIYIVDLRQENHLFIDGESVYWNGSNVDLSTEEVLQNEQALEDELKELLPESEIKSEKELCEEYGVNYVRIAAEDSHFPSEEVVDVFLDFIKALPKNSWLHFHCKEGKGRTTTFMAMYDIYKNPSVSLKDIAYRQYCIGGIYVLYDGCRLPDDDPDKGFSEEREEYTYLFYDYIHRSLLEKGQTWSEWLANNA